MTLQINHRKLFSEIAESVDNVLKNVLECKEALRTQELLEEACRQVQQFRYEVYQYDSDRKNAPKPCKNYRLIADRIVEQLTLRYKWRYVPRAYAYKVMFIMYIICKVERPIRCSWWERTFLDDLPNYLESTDYFKDTSCRTSWALILDKLPWQGRLPLDIDPIVPPQQPEYPIIGPITINNFFLYKIDQTNNGCQQFFGEVNNPTFQKAV